MEIAINFLLCDEEIKLLLLLCLWMGEIICISSSILGCSKWLRYTGKVALISADVT